MAIYMYILFTIFIRVLVQHSPDCLKFRYCTIAATTNISNRIATNEIKKWSTLKLIADCIIESTMQAEPTPPSTDAHHIAGARCVLRLGFCHSTCALTKWTPCHISIHIEWTTTEINWQLATKLSWLELLFFPIVCSYRPKVVPRDFN